MIESFFSKMTKQMLRGICVNTKPELEEQIYHFEEINREPVVYHWKYKMDEISKAEVQRRISRLVRIDLLATWEKLHGSFICTGYKAGQKPITVVSTDNCSHNGDKLYNAISMFADMWVKRAEGGAWVQEYIASDKVSFPWSS